jgi:hypothetical protein
VDITAARRVAYLTGSLLVTLTGCAIDSSPRSSPPGAAHAEAILRVTAPDLHVKVSENQGEVLLNPPYNVAIRTTNVLQVDLLSSDNVAWRLPTSSDPSVLGELSASTFPNGHLTVLYQAGSPGIARLNIVLPRSVPGCAAQGIVVTVTVRAP